MRFRSGSCPTARPKTDGSDRPSNHCYQLVSAGFEPYFHANDGSICFCRDRTRRIRSHDDVFCRRLFTCNPPRAFLRLVYDGHVRRHEPRPVDRGAFRAIAWLRMGFHDFGNSGPDHVLDRSVFPSPATAHPHGPHKRDNRKIIRAFLQTAPFLPAGW